MARMKTASGKMPLLLIFLTVFIDLVGFGIIIPILPTYAEHFGANGLTVGLLLMSYSLMQFVFTPFWGRLSDRIGRRPVILVSLAASCLGYLIWGLADNLALLFVSRLVAGAGNANIAVAQAYIADITTPENRAKGMGLVGAAFGLGFTLGPAIGGITSLLGVHAVGYVAAGFSLFDLILACLFLPEPKEHNKTAGERYNIDRAFYFRTLFDKRLRVPLAIFFISTFAFANMETTLVLLTEKQFGFNQTQNNWMFTYIGILMVIVQGGLIGRLSKKVGEKALISTGALLVIAGLVLTPVSKSVPLLYCALALLAFGSGINNPSNQSILSKLAPQDETGSVLGVGQSLSTLGRIVGPIIGGASFEYLGMQSPYFIGAAAMAIAFLLSLALPKNPQPIAQSLEASSATTSV
jgi:multidrug resistance protein